MVKSSYFNSLTVVKASCAGRGVSPGKGGSRASQIVILLNPCTKTERIATWNVRTMNIFTIKEIRLYKIDLALAEVKEKEN